MQNPGEFDVVVATERLVVHAWRDQDRGPFAALNADPVVMEYFPSVLSADETNVMVDRLIERHDRDGMCFWPVSLRADGSFVGMVGIQTVDYLQPQVAPAVEVGWRLPRTSWGRGYASEAAAACLGYGFDSLGLEEIVAFTTVGNAPSQRVMQRIGMVHDPAADFAHPKLAADHPLSAHVLYRARPTAD